MVYFKLRLRSKLVGLDSDDLQQDFLKDSLYLFRLDPHIYFPYWLLLFTTSVWLFFKGWPIFSTLVSLLTSLHAIFVFFVFSVIYARFYSKWFKD